MLLAVDDSCGVVVAPLPDRPTEGLVGAAADAMMIGSKFPGGAANWGLICDAEPNIFFVRLRAI